MGFKHKINKDKMVRQFFFKSELNKIILKYYINNTDMNMDFKNFLFYKFLRNFHLNSSSARIVNRCILTGKSTWVLRKFRLSRITFKELADNGKINGIRRAT